MNIQLLLCRGAAALAVLASASGAWALDLITPTEADLPSAYAEAKRAGVTRGPGIEVSSPAAVTRKEDVALQIDFRSRGGVVIDPQSVRLVYMKSPTVDLTERIRGHVSESGIALKGAQVPAGEHQLRVDVTDRDGRSSSRLVNFRAE